MISIRRQTTLSMLVLAIVVATGTALADPIVCNLSGCSVGILPGRLVVISPKNQFQHASEWCWAASISMVFAFYGHDVPQEEIVAQAFHGNIANLPAPGPFLTAQLNRSWIDSSGKQFSSTATSFDRTTASFQISPSTIVSDLQANHPLIIGSGGHAMVLTAVGFMPGGPALWGQVADPLFGFHPIVQAVLFNADYTASIHVSP